MIRRLAPRFAAHLADEGRLGAGTGRALVEALTQERPDLGRVIARIEGVADKYPIRDSPAGQVMALQRDASIVAVRMAGMDVSDFARWDRPTDTLATEDVSPTFIGRTQGDRQLEERLIQHDGETMLGWLAQKTHHTSWRAFSGFGQLLLVANAHNDTAEHPRRLSHLLQR